MNEIAFLTHFVRSRPDHVVEINPDAGPPCCIPCPQTGLGWATTWVQFGAQPCSRGLDSRAQLIWTPLPPVTLWSEVTIWQLRRHLSSPHDRMPLRSDIPCLPVVLMLQSPRWWNSINLLVWNVWKVWGFCNRRAGRMTDRQMFKQRIHSSFVRRGPLCLAAF